MSFIIPNNSPSEAFAECWHAACSHINGKLKSFDRPWPSGPFFSWHKVSLDPPFLEHFSFRLGNQLFFVRVEDVDGRVTGPGVLEGLLQIADRQNGFASVMPMRLRSGRWTLEASGWGLLDARTKLIVDPPQLVTTDPVEMSDWEVHDIAVDFVCHNLKREGTKIISSQGDPNIYPSIWHSRSGGAPEWIIVSAVRYPIDPRSIPKPPNWNQTGYASAHLALEMAPKVAADLGTRGYFVAISIARSDEHFDGPPKPILRGYSMISDFSTLSNYPSDVFVLTGKKH